jgi:hypothetical protein
MLATVWHKHLVLGLIRYIMSSFSSTDSLVTMYYALVHSKLEFASVAWNSVMLTDSSKTERVQKKFANLCNNRFLFNLGSKKYKEILARLTSLKVAACRCSVP